jgi:hypothetical protein
VCHIAFTLAEGVEHDVCGIGVEVRFIPATAASNATDFAVVYAGPIGNIDVSGQIASGDQRCPATRRTPCTGSSCWSGSGSASITLTPGT